jgi:hypothetical protein
MKNFTPRSINIINIKNKNVEQSSNIKSPILEVGDLYIHHLVEGGENENEQERKNNG